MIFHYAIRKYIDYGIKCLEGVMTKNKKKEVKESVIRDVQYQMNG